MVRKGLFTLVVLALVSALPLASAARDIEVREYTVPRVGTKPPPTMDGVYSDAEWVEAGPWTGEFVGLNNGANSASWQSEEVPLKYRWRAIWDKDYLYIVMEGETYEFAYNGTPAVVEVDDGVFSYSTGVGQDFEIFFEPNWQQGDGFNSDDFTNPGGDDYNDGFHIIWFVVEADPDLETVANEGARGPNNLEGPPFFVTAGGYNSTYLGDPWNPTFDPSFAAQWNAKPMLGGTSLNRVKNPAPDQPVAKPIMEIGIPFSQLNPDWELEAEGIDETETNLTLTADAKGEYVHPGDEWLVNFSAYVDAYWAVLEQLTLITWNNCLGGAFASYPRGRLIFGPAAVTAVDAWMLR